MSFGNNKLNEIRKLEQKLNDIDTFKYVKEAFLSGIVPAIIAWFLTGTWCYDAFGYETSSSIAILVGLGVMAIFIAVGFAIAECKKSLIIKQIEEIKKPLSSVSSDVPLLERYSKNKYIIRIIDDMTDYLGIQVMRLDRPKHKEYLETYVSATVYEECIKYSSCDAEFNYATLDFEKECKPFLFSENERRAMAQAIAEGVLSGAKKQYSKDICGESPRISATYDIQEHSVYLKITYRFKNAKYVKTTDW